MKEKRLKQCLLILALIELMLFIGVLISLGFAASAYMHSETYKSAVFELLCGQEKREGYEQLRPYAENGDNFARYMLGRSDALGIDRDIDIKQAEKWFDCQGVDECIPGEKEFFLFKEFNEIPNERYWRAMREVACLPKSPLSEKERVFNNECIIYNVDYQYKNYWLERSKAKNYSPEEK